MYSIIQYGTQNNNGEHKISNFKLLLRKITVQDIVLAFWLVIIGITSVRDMEDAKAFIILTHKQ